jgi:16S rRNA (guanine527-N7)-methyltransferase
MVVDTQEKFLRQLSAFYWENGHNPDSMKLEQLAYFADLVSDKNESVNLISRKDIDNVIENHVFISSYISKYIPEKSTKFLDIGTGGGFPGIPLAIMRPDLNGVLVDSTSKKIDAVNEFIDKLMLNNVVAEYSRVESPEFIEKYKNSFDLIVSRATVPIIILFRYSLPLIKDRAFILTVKGGEVLEEIKKAETKYKPHLKKSTIYELNYKPTNIRNIKGKKLVLLELIK